MISNKGIKLKEDELLNLEMTKDSFLDICNVIEVAQNITCRSININLIKRNWLIGYRIAKEELKDKSRSENYGLNIIKNFSGELSKKYGSCFSKTNLYSFYMFYKLYKKIFQSVLGKSFSFLSWTHYSVLIQVNGSQARLWYEEEAKRETWSVRTLQRNISSQNYYRILKTFNKERKLDTKFNKLRFIKKFLTLEFLGLNNIFCVFESELENSIINNLQKILVKGYSFVGKHYHIHTEKSDYYIDLIFYNYILKYFVLVNLKIGKTTHQDVGQMDMYIRMFAKLKKLDYDNSTLGIVFCTDTNKDIVRYSILNESNKLFVSKYKLYLSIEDELRREIKLQKELFYLQQLEKDDENER